MCDNGGYNNTVHYWKWVEAYVHRGPVYTRTVQNNIVSSLILSYILVSKHNCKYAPEEEKVRKERARNYGGNKHRSRNRRRRRRRSQGGVHTHTTIQINTHIRRWRLRRRGREEDCGVRAHTGPGDRRRSMGPWRAPTGTVATPTAVQPGEPGEPGDRRQGSNRSRRDQRNKL